MSASGILTLSKEERLCGRKLIEKLFRGGGSRSMVAFPLRLVYMKTTPEDNSPAVKIMVSVSKKHFKHAVKRNRVKRQIREVYRLNKNILYDRLEEHGNTSLAIVFIWLDNKLWATQDIEKKAVNLMNRLAEKV